MKNNVDIARLNQEFDEFLHELKSDFFEFKENLKKEDQQEHYPPSEQVVIRLI